MADDLQLDEGTGGKYAKTFELSSTKHAIAHVAGLTAWLLATGNMTTGTGRPADTTPYSVGDLMGNTTVVSTITAYTIALATRHASLGAHVMAVKLIKSTTVTADADFRVHFFDIDPTGTDPTGADNAAMSVIGMKDNYLGYIDVSTNLAIFSDGVAGIGYPTGASPIKPASGTSIFALIEARAAYVPGSAEAFDLSVAVLQD